MIDLGYLSMQIPESDMYTNKNILFLYFIWSKWLWNILKVNLELIYKENALANTRLVKISWISFSLNNVASSVNIHQFNLQYLLHPFCEQSPVIASPEELFRRD